MPYDFSKYFPQLDLGTQPVFTPNATLDLPNLDDTIYNKERKKQIEMVDKTGYSVFDTGVQDNLTDYLGINDTSSTYFDYRSSQPNITEYTTQTEDFYKKLMMIDGGLDHQSDLFMLGKSLNFDSSLYGSNQGKAKTMNTVRGIASGANVLFDDVKGVLSGMGYQNRQNEAMEEYFNKLRDSQIGEYKTFAEGGNVGSNIPVEVEDGEYLQQPSGEVEQVVGKKHIKGGEKMMLHPMTDVVSDQVKIGREVYSKLKKEYGLKNIKPTDTFANVIDKFKDKLGFKDIEKEEEYLLRKIDKQDKIKDKHTSDLNKKYLTDKLNSIESQKKVLDKLLSNFTSTIYNLQEKKKGNGESIPKMAYGGRVFNKQVEFLSNKYGLSKDEVINYLNNSGSMLKMGNGGNPIDIFVKNYDRPKYTKEQSEKIINALSQVLPEKVAMSLKNGSIKLENLVLNKDLVNDILQGDEVNFGSQHKTGDYYGGVDSERIQNFTFNDYVKATRGENFNYADKKAVDDLQKEYANWFKDKYGFSFESGIGQVNDGLFGNRTSSYLRAISTVKGGKQGRIDLDKVRYLLKEKGGSDKLNTYLKDYNLSYEDVKDYINNPINKYLEIQPADVVNKGDKNNQQLNNNNTENNNLNRGNSNKGVGDNFLYLPDQSALPPDGLFPHLKADRTYGRLDPVKVSPEENIKEIDRNVNSAIFQLQGLPDAQRTAAIANMIATSDQQINKAITSTNIANQNNQQRVNEVNLRQGDMEENARVTDALDFEKRQLTALAKTDEDLNRYFDYNKKVDINNFNLRHKQQLLNSLFENYNVDSFGNIGLDDDKLIEFYMNKNIG